MNRAISAMSVNMRHAVLVTRAGTVDPLPIPLHLTEGAENGHFALDTHYTSTMYRPRITELSDYCQREGTLEPRWCISGTGTCMTHVKLEHEATSSKRGGNDNYGVVSIFHPDRQMQAKIPPQTKNEVMDGHGQRS
jgi:hypothetical protein